MTVHGLKDTFLNRLSPELRARIVALQEHPPLPAFPAGMRGVPNCCLRSALFGMIQRGQRKALNQEAIVTIRGLQIRYSGWQLDQADFEVLAHALYLVSAQASGKLVRFTAKGFLKGIGRSYGKSGREWLKESLRRLTGSTIDIQQETPGAIGAPTISYSGSLLEEFQHDEAEQSYFLKCNPAMARLFDAGWTQIPWQQHMQLKTDLAKWLHGFYASHRVPFPLKVATLRQLCGSNCRRLSDYRGNLRNAFDELLENGFLTSWHIDKQDKVHIDKQPPKSSSSA